MFRERNADGITAEKHRADITAKKNTRWRLVSPPKIDLGTTIAPILRDPAPYKTARQDAAGLGLA